MPEPRHPRDLRDSRGDCVALGARLGRGGEGEVFEVQGRPGLVAKVFLHHRRGGGKAEKLAAMIERPPAGATALVDGLPVLTWPTALLMDGGQVVGYLMPRVARRDFVPLYQVMTSARRGELGAGLSWDQVVTLGQRLCHLVRTLHRFGYAVGDLNDRNVLVSRRLTPLLMDTDSFQVPKRIGHHPSVVGDALYWPPELLDVDLATYRGSRLHGDRYALGVLLFQLVLDGYRPYQATGSAVAHLETLADKTRAGLYPWAKPRPGVLAPPAAAPDYAKLPKPLRQAFERCFVAGHRHPSRRPTADEWHDVLAQVRGSAPAVAHVAAARAPAPPRPKVARMAPHKPAPRRGRKSAPPQLALVAGAAQPPPARPAKPAAPKRPSRRPRTHARRRAAPRVRWAAWALVSAAAGLLAVSAF